MEEITIALNNRVILGKLIRIYQKEHNMTLYELIDGICSKQVATNMGKGIIAKNDDHYLEMLGKFGLGYNYYHELDDHITKLSKQLKEAVEWYDFKEVERICVKAMDMLRSHMRYAIEFEFFTAFEMVHKYYFVSQEIEKESEHFLKVMWMLNEDLRDVAKCVVFKYYYRYHGFGDKNNLTTQHVREEIELTQSQYPPLMLLEVLCLIIQHKGYDAFKILNYLEEYFGKTKNYNGLLDTYGKVVFLIKAIQIQSLDEYARKIDVLIEQNKNRFDEVRVAMIFLNLGKSYLSENNFERAKVYFYYSLKYPSLFYESSVCLNFIHDKNSENISEELFDEPKDAIGDVTSKRFYNYYFMRFKGVNKRELNIYLKDEILKKTSKDNYYYHIFLEELSVINSGKK